MSGGFFRGTSADQDTRFSNKTAKLLKTQKFAPELDQLVDMNKVKMDAIRPWIATRVTQLLGFEDEVLINFIYGLLEGKDVDGKQIQIQLTGFMEKNTGKFMRELWNLLTSAQNNISGIPQQFLDEKAEETRKKKAEDQRIVSEFRKKEEDRKDAEQQRSNMHNVSSEATRVGAPMVVKSTSSRSPRGFSGGRSPDSVHRRAKNGNLTNARSPVDCVPLSRQSLTLARCRLSVPKRNGSGDASPISMHHVDRRRSRSRSRSGSILSSRSVSRSPHLRKRRVSRSVSRSPKRVRRSRSPPRHGRTPIINRSPRRRRSRSPPRRGKSPILWSPPRSRRRSPGYLRSSPRRRSRPSPSPRRRQAPSLSPRQYAHPISSPRRRPTSRSPRRRPALSQSPRRRPALSRSPRRRPDPPSPRRRTAPLTSPLGQSPHHRNPSLSPRRRWSSPPPRSPQQRLRHLSSSQGRPIPSTSPQKNPVSFASPSRHIVRSVLSPPRTRRVPSSSPRKHKTLPSPPSRSPSPSPSLSRSPSPSPLPSPRQQRSRSFSDSPPAVRSPKINLLQIPTSLSKERKDFNNRAENRREESRQFSRSGVVENLGLKKSVSPARESTFSLEKKQVAVKQPDGFDANASTFDAIKHGAKPLEPARFVSKASDDDHGKGHAGNRGMKMESDGEEDGATASPTTSTDARRKAAKKRRKEEKRIRKEERRRKREEKQKRKEERRAAKVAAKAIPSVTPPPDLDNNRLVITECFDGVEKYQKSEDDEMESEQRRLENELRKKALDSIRAKKAVNL